MKRDIGFFVKILSLMILFVFFLGSCDDGSQAPTTPHGFAVSAISTSSIRVDWSPVSGADYYIVYRSHSQFGTYTQIGNSTATSYTDTGLPRSTTFYYQVSAVNSVGESARTAHRGATTFTFNEGSPRAPLGLNITANPSNSITVRWDSVPGVAEYIIYRADMSSTTTSSPGSNSYMAIGSSPASSTSYTDTGLLTSRRYYYRISAVNSYGEGVPSSPVSAIPQN